MNITRLRDGAVEVLNASADAEDWASDSLLVAAVVPWLPKTIADEAASQIAKC